MQSFKDIQMTLEFKDVLNNFRKVEFKTSSFSKII